MRCFDPAPHPQVPTIILALTSRASFAQLAFAQHNPAGVKAQFIFWYTLTAWGIENSLTMTFKEKRLVEALKNDWKRT